VRYLAGAAVLFTLGPGPRPACAFDVAVTSTPPGAGVYASPTDQPIAYQKGLTPCRIELGDEGAPFALLIRKPGFLDAYRYVGEDSPDLSVALASRDDPANWAQLPGLTSLTSIRSAPKSGAWGVVRHGRVMRRITGMPRFIDDLQRWAPDGSGALCRGAAWGDTLVEEGLAKKDTGGEASDLWWVPLDGEPKLIWRWQVERHDEPFYFLMSGDFAPDPRWCVHSATGEGREHLRLRNVWTGEDRLIAADDEATLYSPRFSSSGRLIACVRHADFQREPQPAQIQVMHFNGSGRRTVAYDADEDFDPVFSPDEQWIAYVNLDGNVALVSVQGGDTHVPIADPEWQALGEPVWSPDGTRLAATFIPREGESDLSRGPTRIIWASIDGEETRFIRGASVVDWHGEEAFLAVVRGFIVRTGTGFDRLVVLGLDGSLQHVLREPEALLHNAQVSPDDRWVAAVGWHGEDAWDVYVYGVETGAITNVTEGPLSGEPETGWTADGELWVSASGEAGAIIDVRDGSTREVAQRPELAQDDAQAPPFECRRGDLFKATEIGYGGSPVPASFVRRTFFNMRLDLAPTTAFGGGL